MAASLQLESSGVTDLRQKFYELLLEFATFPAAQNFFLVSIADLPSPVYEEHVDKLGLRPGTGWSTGLNVVKEQVFKPFFGGGNNWMFLATGVDLTTETTSVNNKGTLINGLLPVGPFMESREFPDNDLSIQFSETNVSIIDSIFRSWIQLYSVYGNMGDVQLVTDVTIYFISKQTSNTSDDTPSVTKIYTYKDCIPYVIKDANVAEYDGDTKMSSVAVGWRFSKYDVRIPVRGAKFNPFESFKLPEEGQPLHEIPYLGKKPSDFIGPREEFTAEYDIPQKKVDAGPEDKPSELPPQKKVSDFESRHQLTPDKMDKTQIAEEAYLQEELKRIGVPLNPRSDIDYGQGTLTSAHVVDANRKKAAEERHPGEFEKGTTPESRLEAEIKRTNAKPENKEMFRKDPAFAYMFEKGGRFHQSPKKSEDPTPLSEGVEPQDKFIDLGAPFIGPPDPDDGWRPPALEEEEGDGDGGK
jgi:hypothetical protein